MSIQAQVVNLMKDIQQNTGCAYMFIAHDLSMVKYISDRIGVLHMGHLVETGSKGRDFPKSQSTPTPKACFPPFRIQTPLWKRSASP